MKPFFQKYEYSIIRRLLTPPALSGTGRPYLFGYFCATVAFDQGRVVLALEFEPETGTVAEIAAKPNRRLGGDRSAAVQDVRDTARGNTEC